MKLFEKQIIIDKSIPKHYDVNYEGEHEAIIPREQWDKVQQMMSTNAGEVPGNRTGSFG